MASKLKLLNENGKVLELSSGSITTDKQLDPKDFKYIRNTMKDMLDLNGKLEDYDVVFLKGYHTVNDGGGGTFVYNQFGSKSDHNGGTIIDPSKTFPEDWTNQTELNDWFNTNNSGNGILERIYNDSVNVKWFGANGDGVTDDTLAIQKSFSIEDTDCVLGSESIYIVSNDIIVKSSKIYGNISTINFSNNGTLIIENINDFIIRDIKVINTNNYGIYIKGQKNNLISNILIDNIYCENTPSAGLTIEYVLNCKINNSTFKNCRDNGIYASFSSAVIISNNNVFDCGGSSGITVGYPSYKYDKEGYIITNNLIKKIGEFTNNLISGIDIVSTNSFLCSSNTILDGKTGILVEENIVQNGVIENNYINNNLEYGIRIDSSATDNTHQTNKIVIANNTIIGSWFGIYVNKASLISINNNTIYNYIKTGIQISYSNFINIFKNILKNNRQQASYTPNNISINYVYDLNIMDNKITQGIGGYISYNSSSGTFNISGNNRTLTLKESGSSVLTTDLIGKTLNDVKTEIESINGWSFDVPTTNLYEVFEYVYPTKNASSSEDTTIDIDCSNIKKFIGELSSSSFLMLQNVEYLSICNNLDLRDTWEKYKNFISSVSLKENMMMNDFYLETTKTDQEILTGSLPYKRGCLLKISGTNYSGSGISFNTVFSIIENGSGGLDIVKIADEKSGKGSYPLNVTSSDDTYSVTTISSGVELAVKINIIVNAKFSINNTILEDILKYNY